MALAQGTSNEGCKISFSICGGGRPKKYRAIGNEEESKEDDINPDNQSLGWNGLHDDLV